MSAAEREADGEQLDHNLLLRERGGAGTIVCGHCGHLLAYRGEDPEQGLVVCESEVGVAGPHIRADARLYIDRDVIFRQLCCPACFIAFRSEVVPVEAKP